MTPPPFPVLMYHSMTPIPGPLGDLGVSPTLLGEHLEALRGAGYRIVGLSAALALAATGVRVAGLTFDDGFRDVLDALPVLADTGSTATLYVPAAHIGATATWLDHRPDLLDWAEVRSVAAAGIEIGSHGHVHRPLDVLPPIEMARQVGAARARIAQETGAPVRSFAYPHGYHTARVRVAVAAAGHDSACEVGRRVVRPGDDRFALPRLQPTPDLDGAGLLAIVRGDPALMAEIRRLAQPGWRFTRRLAGAAGITLT
jgi:peptidoglycan/xylan/chitin deacetylase (PgdA/CDA1 family)